MNQRGNREHEAPVRGDPMRPSKTAHIKSNPLVTDPPMTPKPDDAKPDPLDVFEQIRLHLRGSVELAEQDMGIGWMETWDEDHLREGCEPGNHQAVVVAPEGYSGTIAHGCFCSMADEIAAIITKLEGK